MKCQKCQFYNLEGASFCGQCGAKLLLICPRCNAKNLPQYNFCDQCSYDLRQLAETLPIDFSKPRSYTPKYLADKIFTNRSAIEGERKQVTVFFADVAGFTSFSEKLDPEQVHRIMDKAFRIMMNEIHKHDGTINQFTGDGVMALFGAPLAFEDHAQKACRAAFAIQKAINKYSKELERKIGLQFKMRVGINSGWVVVGSIGDDLRMDYTAIGNTTNLASRMERMARPGTVLLSSNTYKKVRQEFEIKPLGKVKVKGIQYPLKVFELIKDKVYRPQLGFERRIYSEMVGRDDVFKKLKRQVIKAINGDGAVLNIIGEAGIGKSRLVAELKNQDIMKQVTFFQGRAISMGRNLSFHPIIDLLKQWAKIEENDKESVAFDKLNTAVTRVCSEDGHEVLPFVAILMRIKLSGRYAERIEGIEGEALEKLIIKNLRHLLIKATELTPLAIVMEDLHWADTSSVELLESLFRLVETQRIIFFNVFRPGYKETSDRIIETIKEKLPEYYIEIVLQSLDERMSETLINNMLNIRGLHHVVMDRIVQRAGGNPFFIEEVVRSFIDAGALVPKDGSFEVTEKIDTMVVPHTINDVLMARIDRLDEKTRNLVKVASVIGRSFFYRILTEMMTTVEDLDSRLSYLKEIQLIRDRRRMEELEYLFKHALAQEAAYESILIQKREKLHLRVADSIEKVFKERLHEFYGMLAYHYGKGEDEEKAEEYLIKAGEEALKSSASSEALHYYQNAMELYIKKYEDSVDSKKMADLEENIAFAFFSRGYYVEAVDYFDKALNNLGIQETNNEIFYLIKFILNFLSLVKSLYLPSIRKKKIPIDFDNQVMNIIFHRAKALANVDSKRFFIETIWGTKQCFNFNLYKSQIHFNTLSGSSMLFSLTGISLNISKKILDYSKKYMHNENGKFSFHFYNNVETVHNFLSGNWQRDFDENIIDRALEAGDTFCASFTLGFLGYLYTELGDFASTERIIQKLNTISDEYNDEQATVMFYEVNASLFFKKRGLDSALSYCQKSIALLDKIRMGMRGIKGRGMIAYMQVLKDDLHSAKRTLDETANLIHKIGKDRIPFYTYLFFELGTFVYHLAKLEKAIVLNDKADISEFKKVALKSGKKAKRNSKKVAGVRTETFRLMGTYYWFIDKQRKALKWWGKSIKEGERLGARPELSRTFMEVGKRLLQQESKYKELYGVRAEEYLTKAREMFEELDLH